MISTVTSLDVANSRYISSTVYLLLGVDDARRAYVPSSVFQYKSVHVDAFQWRSFDIVLLAAHYITAQTHIIQAPTLAFSSRLL